MDELSSMEVIRLDATPEGKPIYSRMGFTEDQGAPEKQYLIAGPEYG